MTDQILTALAALASLRQAAAWLHDAPTAEAQPGLRRPPAPRQLTTRAAGRADRLLRTERAERAVTDIPSTPHVAPVREALLDAATAVYDTAVDAAWIVASGLRRRQLLVVHEQARQLWPDPWAAAILQLQVGIPWLVCDCVGEHRGGCLDIVARQVGQLLSGVDDQARLVLGVGPAWVPLAGQACPTCRRRTVEAEVSSMDERQWIARCREGCWIRRVEDLDQARDTFALIKSYRRHSQKRARAAA